MTIEKMTDSWTDIGCGHKIKFTNYKDDPCAGLRDKHLRPDNGQECQGFIAIKDGAWANEFNGDIPKWAMESKDPLTLSPSILCRTCGDHGFIREGKWVKA